MKSDVLIYQMGRVGSNSVRRALGNAGINSLHVHYLYEPVEPNHGNLTGDRAYISDHLEEPYTIISMMRDPFARAVSSWFRQKNNSDLEKLSPEDVVEDVVNGGWLTWGLIWFETQLVHHTKRPLEVLLRGLINNHYSEYRFRQGRGFVFRTENLSTAAAILSHYFQKDILITHQNSTYSREDTREHYTRLYHKLKFHPATTDFVLNSRIMQLCYSPAELESLEYRWTKR